MTESTSHVSTSHFLSGCRYPVLRTLKRRHRDDITPEHRGTVRLLTLTSVLLWPLAGLEKLLWDPAIRRTRVEKDPLFVLSFWRMGTTYIHNVLVQDRQFGWFDPIDVMVVNNSRLLRPLLKPFMNKVLAGGRPMDNLDYRMDLPMEEVFALAQMGDRTITDMLAFPACFADYAECLYIEDADDYTRACYKRDYPYLIAKQTLRCKGKRLVLKSPDNTARTHILRELYPQARFVHIHRDPYTTVQSAIKMFYKEFQLQGLTALPPMEYAEDMVIGHMARVYRTYLADREQMPRECLYEVEYEDFCADPVGQLQEMYARLGLEGFEAARPRFEAYVESLGEYRRNSYTLEPRLQDKIEQGLGFYFEEYGYPYLPRAGQETAR